MIIPTCCNRELVPAFIQCCLYDLPSTGIGSHIFHIWKIQLHNWEPISLSCEMCMKYSLIYWERNEPINLIYGISFLRLHSAWSIPLLRDFIGCGKRDPYLSTHHCFRPNRLSGWITCFLKPLVKHATALLHSMSHCFESCLWTCSCLIHEWGSADALNAPSSFCSPYESRLQGDKGDWRIVTV